MCRQNLYDCKLSQVYVCLNGEMLTVWKYMEILKSELRKKLIYILPFAQGANKNKTTQRNKQKFTSWGKYFFLWGIESFSNILHHLAVSSISKLIPSWKWGQVLFIFGIIIAVHFLLCAYFPSHMPNQMPSY